MRKSNRDDFPPRTKQKLWVRVSGRCSNPACRVQTQGPASDEDGTVNIGKASHITAAAPGGPRYDSSLKPEQRKGLKNGIWLCAIHADLVDKDITGHQVDLLYGWKQQAEQAAKRELGQRLPSDDDAIRTLSAAFTGNATSFIPSAVRNVHAAMSQSLRVLDPRFSVNSSYTNGMTQFEIAAEEPVKLSISFDVAMAPDLPAKVTALLAQGRDFEIDANAVSIRGSPLWDHIAAETSSGKFGLMASRRSVRLKLWLQHDGQAERHFLDDMDGYVTVGTESSHFEASGWSELLAVSMDVPFAATNVDTKVALTLGFQSWQMVDVRRLPHFNTLARMMEHLNAGAQLFLRVEAEGNPVLTSNRIELSQYAWVTNTSILLEYVRLARSLTSVLGQSVKFDVSRDISAENQRLLAEMERVATGKLRIPKAQIKSNPRITITANENGVHLLAVAESQQVIQIQNQHTPAIEIFGQTVTLPNRVTTMHPVGIKLLGDPQKITTGERVIVEVLMLENFEFSMDFEKTD